MNKLLESEHLKNEDVTEEIKIPAVSEENAEESVAVDTDESVNVELPVESPVESTIENPVEQDPVAEAPADISAPPETLPVEEEIPGKTDDELVAEPEDVETDESENVETDESEDVETDEPENVETDEPEDVETDEPAELSVVDLKEIEKLDKTQLIEQFAEAVQQDITNAVKNKVEMLKQAFYKLKKIETDEAQEAFVAGGGLAEDFEAAVDASEEKLKELLTVFREKKAVLAAKADKIKEENLLLKKAIIEKLKELIESNDDFYKVYNEFRKLQQQWKEIKQVPQAAVNELWKDYQHYSEKFYDLLKINNEMRDYDFKKNLELKQGLIDSVERLDSEKDVISAFYQLQKFHQEWREIGPVAKELREEIWSRFKKASSVINKKHQEHFESLRALEQRNLEEKTAICEEMEAIDFSKITTFKDWDEQNKRVLELQEKWKTIGFAPKKNNVKIFERFRKSCDVFFQNKSVFYRGIKETMDVNLEKKKALCEQAEALKDSQDWKETSDKLIALQKEWKTIGPVSRKFSDAVWKRFIGACDYFFEQKSTHFSSQKSEEVENLKKKKEIIQKINEIDVELAANEAILQIRELMSEWNKIGFVPFREKDKIYKEYRTAVDKHFDRLKIDESERRLQSFKSNLNELSSGEKSKNKLLNEREKLMRTYERLKSDIQTYENNIGFLSISSKGGGGLVKEMNRKIDSLKEELSLIVKKIEVIDENFA
ncbi:MAG: DUF349 domain-containing protein [Dysgonamonadaceae bacterium]|nr:DUF349 domain-containing protein [Dysgonamonadaceae bacterium]